jgi:hypothetical protein
MNQCVTVSYGRVYGKAKNYPYYQPCIYEEYITQKNEKKWKLKQVRGAARRSFSFALREAVIISQKENIPFLSGIRQWTKVN